MNRGDKPIKKKPSGSEYKRRRIEKEAEVKKNTQSIDSWLTKGSTR